jgi:hypothetical protein
LGLAGAVRLRAGEEEELMGGMEERGEAEVSGRGVKRR